MQSNLFLSDAPYMSLEKNAFSPKTIRTPFLPPILAVLTQAVISSARGGLKSLQTNSLISPSHRDEMNCSRSEGASSWAKTISGLRKISEASATKLSNFFGKREYEKIKEGMSIDEVNRIVGCPPGAYFAGTVGLGYPSGIRTNGFTGHVRIQKEPCGVFADQSKAQKKPRLQERMDLK